MGLVIHENRDKGSLTLDQLLEKIIPFMKINGKHQRIAVDKLLKANPDIAQKALALANEQLQSKAISKAKAYSSLYPLNAVNQNFENLRFVPVQTDALCRLALKKNPRLAFPLILAPTEDMCVEAVNLDVRVLDIIPTHLKTRNVWFSALNKNALILKDFPFQNDDICLATVQRNCRSFEYVENQTDEICLAAVRQNGLLLDFVDFQTPEICLASVKQNGLALQFVDKDKKTREVCLAAVTRNGLALQFVDVVTDEIALVAVAQNADAVRWVKHQSKEVINASLDAKNGSVNCHFVDSRFRNDAVIFEAIKSEPWRVRENRHQTEDFCLTAVRINPRALGHLTVQSDEVCRLAVARYPGVIKHVRKQTTELCLAAVSKDGKALAFVRDQTPEICLAAIENEPRSLKFVKYQTEALCLHAVKKKWRALADVRCPTLEMVCVAFQQKSARKASIAELGIGKDLYHQALNFMQSRLREHTQDEVVIERPRQ